MLFGFEGSMNGDFYHSVLNAYLESSQTIRVEGGVQSDYPVARICAITSTNFVIRHSASGASAIEST